MALSCLSWLLSNLLDRERTAVNMISELRQRVFQHGTATINVEEFDQLQREWITRAGAESLVEAERE